MYNLSTINEYKLHNKNTPIENLLYYTEESIYITEGAGIIAIIVAIVAAIIAIIGVIIVKLMGGGSGGGGGGGGSGLRSASDFINGLFKTNNNTAATVHEGFYYTEAGSYDPKKVLEKRISLLKDWLKTNTIKIPKLNFNNFMRRGTNVKSQVDQNLKEIKEKINYAGKINERESAGIIRSTFDSVNRICAYTCDVSQYGTDNINFSPLDHSIDTTMTSLYNLNISNSGEFANIKQDLLAIPSKSLIDKVSAASDLFTDTDLNDFNQIYDELAIFYDYRQNTLDVFKTIEKDFNSIRQEISKAKPKTFEDSDLDNYSSAKDPKTKEELTFYYAKMCLKMWKDTVAKVSAAAGEVNTKEKAFFAEIKKLANQTSGPFAGSTVIMTAQEIEDNMQEEFQFYENIAKQKYGTRY